MHQKPLLRLRQAIVFGLAMLASPTAWAADTLSVPAQFPTIQSAIIAAQTGDTVLVADGVYTGAGNRDLNFLGKALIVRSENGPSSTTIDAQGTSTEPYRGFVFENGESRSAVLDGFTITGGATFPGAVNDEFNGGAIIIRSSSPTIRNCHFVANSSGCWGGAVYSGDTGPLGGTSSPLIENCLFQGNYTDDDGGGFFTWGFSAEPKQPTVIRNSAFIGNGAAVTGGAITDFGGANLVLENITVVGNAATWGSAINAGNVVLRNSIVWGNGAGGIQTWGTANVSFSNVEGGVLTGLGNMSVKPLLRADGYHLRPNSPMIDAGINAAGAPSSVQQLDIDGQPRLIGRRVDIGADESRTPTAATEILGLLGP